jgi:hypothetical protein
MQKYFSNIDLVDGLFVGTIFNSNTNSEVYKTKPYEEQSQVLQDINIYVQTATPPTTDPTPLSNTVQYTTVPVRKCCGG